LHSVSPVKDQPEDEIAPTDSPAKAKPNDSILELHRQSQVQQMQLMHETESVKDSDSLPIERLTGSIRNVRESESMQPIPQFGDLNFGSMPGLPIVTPQSSSTGSRSSEMLSDITDKAGSKQIALTNKNRKAIQEQNRKKRNEFIK
jgi:hypothetical protein